MATNALTIALPTESEFDVMVRTAKSLVQSGFLPSDVNTPQKAVAIMMMSRELGIGAWAGLNGINVIQGKPTISPQLMLALINRSGELEDMTISGDETACTVMMKRRGRSEHVETFTIKDAAALGLTDKSNWRKMPATMLKWRAISACARVVFPDVIIGFYTPEEIDPGVTVDAETGEVVDAQPDPPSRPASIVTQAEPPSPSIVTQAEPSPSIVTAGPAEPPASIVTQAEPSRRPASSRQAPPVEGEVVGEGKPEPKPHWIDNPKARTKFWLYTKNDLKLTEEQVYEALGVKSIHAFDGTMQQAKDKLDTYADALHNAPPDEPKPSGRPKQLPPSAPPPWDKGYAEPLFHDQPEDIPA